MRLTTKPGVSLQRIGSFPSRPASANTVSTARGEASSVRTTSTSGRTGAGLKKCMPTTRSGWTVALAIVRDGERRRVRRQHGLLTDQVVQRAEQLLLEVELLDDRLDYDVAAGEVAELGRRRQPAERRIALVRRQPTLLDPPLEIVGDPLSSALAQLLAHLAADRLDPRLHADLRDPGTHRAETDHPHRSHFGSGHPSALILTRNRIRPSRQPLRSTPNGVPARGVLE